MVFPVGGEVVNVTEELLESPLNIVHMLVDITRLYIEYGIFNGRNFRVVRRKLSLVVLTYMAAIARNSRAIGGAPTELHGLELVPQD